MKLINKDALVAEINKRIIDAPIDCYGHQRVWAYNDVKDIINTIEVKWVDLEKEIKEQVDDCWIDEGSYDVSNWIRYRRGATAMTVDDVKTIAKHFFELGLKAQKGEEI